MVEKKIKKNPKEEKKRNNSLKATHSSLGEPASLWIPKKKFNIKFFILFAVGLGAEKNLKNF